MARKNSEHVRENTSEVWSNFAPNSTLYSVGGQRRLDVVSVRQADGSLKIVPDYASLLEWLIRYGPGGIACANIIVFPEEGLRSATKTVSRQIAYHLTAFRALKKLAIAYGRPLSLDRVHFYCKGALGHG